MNKYVGYIFKQPKIVLIYVISLFAKIIPDSVFVKWMFRINMGYPLNLDNPQTFSEKLQWLKLYNRKPEYTQMVDKYEVKKYVADKIGEEYIIPTLGVWDKVDDIDFDTLPNQFVLKTTHDSGGVVICKDKNTFDTDKAKKILNKSIKKDYYVISREWPYKNVKPRIIAEQYMVDESGYELKDYKFFCFNGEPKYCQVISGRKECMSIDFYNKEWIHQPFHEPKKYPFSEKKIIKPINYEKMISMASQLSAGIPFVRIDFYSIYKDIYFGEITFFPTSGMGGFKPEEWDFTFGSWIELPLKLKLE